MSLGVILDIAKNALAAQQYGINVTGHNIANVNTEGYSLQTPLLTTLQPSTTGGVIVGRGVEIDHVLRVSDRFIESQLMQGRSSLASSEEMEKYMQVLEGSFNENSETGISTLMTDFWNFWHDISNNPSGVAERIALYEHSLMLSERMNLLESDLGQIKTDLSGAIGVAIEKVNQISEEIAQLNQQIVKLEANSIANDLRDKRNALVSKISEYIDVKVFEQDTGEVTVVTARGCILVNKTSSFDLELGGAGGDRVRWLNSNGATIDITDDIEKGKLGGWLDMRDEVLEKNRLDLDAMVREFIWSVNRQHSQGVGLKLFRPGTTLAGSYQTPGDLGDLEFGDRIVFCADAFRFWIEDRTDPANPDMNFVSVDLSGLGSGSQLSDLAAAINAQTAAAGLAGITADGSGKSLSFSAGNDYAFGFSDDQSNILAALGINTFFEGTGAGSIAVNAVLGEKDYIAAAQIADSGGYGAGDNSNAMAIADLQYAATQIPVWTCDRNNGNSQGSTTATLENYYHALVGTIGIKASSIADAKAFGQEMVSRLSNLRDSISAVSLDEEMTNLVKFQHAYSAAAKLVSVSDEMLQTLLEVK